ncbi:hypothetical protein [Neolewinella persica]|uniref:hypothetical protein n=1 Tax=Neolewinella persica TaxID=70998 RepID=UPI0003683A9D|nr:hypothetical protein [Neolewinella persica]
MRNLLLLAGVLLLAATFSSCLEETDSFINSEGVEQLSRYEAAINGTGLPREAELRNAVFTNTKNGQSIEVSLGHIRIGFFLCGDSWCRARTDDCGQSANLDYQYRVEGDQEKIAFQDFEFIPIFKDWAENADFNFNRNGADLKFDCTDCPGRTSDGFEFTDRRVVLRVIQ